MGHIEIAAVHHRLYGVQLAEIRPDIVLPLHTVIQPGQLILGIGSIAAYQIELRVLRRDDPALMPVDLFPEVTGNRERRPPGKDGGAGVTCLVGAVPVALIARQLKRRLLRPHFRLLKADHVGVRKGAEIQEALAETRPQAVDIPRYQFHKSSRRHKMFPKVNCPVCQKGLLPVG